MLIGNTDKEVRAFLVQIRLQNITEKYKISTRKRSLRGVVS